MANTDIDASTNEELLEQASDMGVLQGPSKAFLGKEGVWSNKVSKLRKKLQAQTEEANLKAQNELARSAENIQDSQLANMEANYAAFGGCLGNFFKNGGKKNLYLGSQAIRDKIRQFEGSDWEGQVKQWHGDPVGVHARWIVNQLGEDGWNHLTNNQKDALISYRYNTSVKAFTPTLNLVKQYIKSGYNPTYLQQIQDSINVGAKREGMSGLAKRRAYEQNLFATPDGSKVSGKQTSAFVKHLAKQQQELDDLIDIRNTQAVNNYINQQRLDSILSAPVRKPQTITADTDL